MAKEKIVFDTITSDLIDEVRNRLSENRQVRRTLPGSGRIHIDRNLPFLCVYRRPVSRADSGTDMLVKGEASYLIASASSRDKSGINSLVRTVVQTLSRIPKAFLIIEIWTRTTPISIFDPDKGRTAPSFRIFVPPERISPETVESLKKALSQVTISKKKAGVYTIFSNRPWPEKLPALLTPKEIADYNCFLLGIEIAPVFQNPDSHDVYPLVLKKLHRGLSVALKKSVYEFSHKRTTTRPVNYKSLGRRASVKAVWEVDNKLAEISNEFDFLLLVTPVNIEQSWNKFRSSRYDREPVFYYRPITIDPSILKRRLYDIPFDKIEDPTLLSIFHEKLVELEMKFSMLRDRNTKNFFYGSMQLFGDIDDELYGVAKNILTDLSPKRREKSRGKIVSVDYFAERARNEINLYKKIFPDIESKVVIRDDITGLMVSNGNLFLGNKVQIPESRVEALIQHEVGTHVLTYINGRHQPFQQLYCGLSGSDELQEGIAVLAEYLVGGLNSHRLRLLAGRIMAVKALINGASFIDTFRELHFKFGFTNRIAFIITSRIFRGGGFTKDAIYLRGFIDLVKYIRAGGDLSPLMIGKISMEDLPLIKELQLRKVLNPVLLKPQYFENPQYMVNLDRLREGTLIFGQI